MPLIEEEIDGLSGLLFPFYDADTHMLYLAGKVRAGLRIPQQLGGRRRDPSAANGGEGGEGPAGDQVLHRAKRCVALGPRNPGLERCPSLSRERGSVPPSDARCCGGPSLYPPSTSQLRGAGRCCRGLYSTSRLAKH